LSTQHRAIGAFNIPTPSVSDFEDFKTKLHSSLKTSVNYGSTHEEFRSMVIFKLLQLTEEKYTWYSAGSEDKFKFKTPLVTNTS